MRSSIEFACSFLLALPSAHAWGTVGHVTIATIANNYLTSQAKTYVSGLLGEDVSIASVATWADSYRYTAAGTFSRPFHYIDANDSPPTSCSVNLPRDCESTGCIVSAIANYTRRVNDDRLSATNRKQAMEFLIHFLGDITQPLHVEALKIGGNDIPVTWDGEDTNLHSVWDTQMVEKAAGGKNSTTVVNSYATTLITRIDSGTYASETDDWLNCVDVTTASDCALQWAQDASALNCVYVLKTDVEGMELDGDYYTGAQPYFELQIAKGGYRLAAWINELAAAA